MLFENICFVASLNENTIMYYVILQIYIIFIIKFKFKKKWFKILKTDFFFK